MIHINNHTELYISVSAKPGNFGATIYNTLFQYYDINAVYLPRKAFSAKKLVSSIKNMKIAGCSVSMPLKSKILDYLDEFNPLAQKTQSVNTIINRDDKLIGFNTDFFGFKESISNLQLKKVLVYGAGSVVSSILVALQERGGIAVNILARNSESAEKVAKQFGVGYLTNVDSVKGRYDLLINATPASVEKEHELYQLLPLANGILDLVVSPKDTPLILKARKLGLAVVAGIEMSKFQLQYQFELYTGVKPEIKQIDNIINKYYKT